MFRSSLPLIFSLAAAAAALGICNATTYLVGGTTGWDISTDLDSWSSSINFVVGDVLLFVYSSSHSVVEVKNRESYDSCNTAHGVQFQRSSGAGNTTITLTKPGPHYFVCGNRLHCLSGMKLLANVATNGSSSAPSSAPPPSRAPRPAAAAATGSSGQPAVVAASPRPPVPASLPRPTSKNNYGHINN